MGALHTYKFNDDLFKKVTTLLGATNHGMVMVLDWSGSMCDNLKGTIEQLLQLVCSVAAPRFLLRCLLSPVVTKVLVVTTIVAPMLM